VPSFWNRRQAASVVRLAAPIAATQIGMVLYGTVDMMFVGRLGPSAIAAVGLGSITYFTLFVVGMGVVMGIDSHSAKAFGAGRVDDCGQLLVHTLVIALVVGIPLFWAYSAAGAIYRLIGVDPVAIQGAVSYLHILRWGIFPGLCFVAGRQFLQSMSVTSPLLVAIVAGNVVNAALDATLVFGKFGAPAMGIRGSAVATLCANGVMLGVVAEASRRRLSGADFQFRGWRRQLFRDVFLLGLPGGFQMLAEVAVFALVTALAGRFGAETLAAHQLTLNLASMTFMIPMGLSHAAAARVGQELGRGDPTAARECGNAAATISVSFMSLTGFLFAAAPTFFLGLYGPGPNVIRLGIPLLYCSAAFQVFDGAQGVLTGALRGLGEARGPFLYNLIGHWLIGLPLGYWLAFHRGFGATGLWLGLVAGLVIVATLLAAQWRRISADAADEI
jgi:MATE family multidrug resistance protein